MCPPSSTQLTDPIPVYSLTSTQNPHPCPQKIVDLKQMLTKKNRIKSKLEICTAFGRLIPSVVQVVLDRPQSLYYLFLTAKLDWLGWA